MPPQITDAATETAVIMQFLEPAAEAITPIQLYATIRERGVTPNHIDAAILSLTQAGVLDQDDGGALRRSAALTRLDDLGLIGL